MAKSPRRVVSRRGQVALPEGVVPGQQMPGGPMVYVSKLPAPNVILLQRWTLNYGPTVHRDVLHRAGVAVPREGPVRSRPKRLPPSSKDDEGMSGLGAVDNPYGGRSGWLLRAMGPVAYRDRGLTGKPDSVRVSHWYERIPPEERIYLFPTGRLPKGDPLLAPGWNFRPWISDECIVTLINAGTKGTTGIKPLKFAVLSTQVERSAKERDEPLGPAVQIYPIQVLSGIYTSSSGKGCTMQAPSGMTLQQAGAWLGFGSTRKDLVKALGVGAGTLYEVWRERAGKADTRQQIFLNVAYHRVLVARFLKSERLTPTAPKGMGSVRPVAHEVERRANLLQAYRVFVFNDRGCPVGINQRFLESNNLQVKPIMERRVPYAGFTRGSPRARKWTTWLYDFVLQKSVMECGPTSIHGLEDLLVAVDALQ